MCTETASTFSSSAYVDTERRATSGQHSYALPNQAFTRCTRQTWPSYRNDWQYFPPIERSTRNVQPLLVYGWILCVNGTLPSYWLTYAIGSRPNWPRRVQGQHPCTLCGMVDLQSDEDMAKYHLTGLITAWSSLVVYTEHKIHHTLRYWDCLL